MKRKNIIIVMLLVFTGLITIQSCTKDTVVPLIFKAAVPENPTPANDAVVPLAGTTYTIKWEGTSVNPWDVYIGINADPVLAKAGVAGNTYTFTSTAGGEVFWYVVTTDVNKMKSTSPTWNYYINSGPTVPAITAPANNAVKFSAAGALTWTCTDAEDDAITYDVFIGKTSTTLGVAATNLTAATYSPAMEFNTTYFWKVVAKDVHGAKSESAVNTFTTDVFRPDFSVYNGVSSEISTSFSATAKRDVYLQINTTAKTITMFLPVADAMVAAGWGTAYSGTHPITISYDPIAMTVTSTKQIWTDSFIDPEEMGPMYLTVKSGTIDPANKKITIIWTLSGNAYWGGDYAIKASTYTMK
jgi:hypothetical protein